MRRSTRGGPPPPPASATSSSSLSSTRLDRHGRTHHTTNHKSTTPHSLSSEEEPPRRSQRAHIPNSKSTGSGRPSAGATTGDDGDAEMGGEEEEVTRCLCGQTEYPGPPDIETFAGIVDAGDLFIQCDGCTVWQHGGCVGIAEERQVPDKYYCEECDPALHRIHTDSRGQRYSLYLPLHPRARKASTVKHDDKAKKERESLLSRASIDPSTGKRRITMRSKELDDEEEQLKRAIEESRREVEAGSESSGRKSTKRGRDDSSEDSKHDLKRQRTLSESRPSVPSLEFYSDDEEATPKAGRLKRVKPESNHTTRQTEQRERDKERDKARAEAAGRRQARAGRRRADDSDVFEEPTPKASSSAHTSPPPSSSQPNSPPPIEESERSTNRKGSIKQSKKLGSNQYSSKSRGGTTNDLLDSPHSRRRTYPGGPPSGDEDEEDEEEDEDDLSSGGVPLSASKGAIAGPRSKASSPTSTNTPKAINSTSGGDGATNPTRTPSVGVAAASAAAVAPLAVPSSIIPATVVTPAPAEAVPVITTARGGKFSRGRRGNGHGVSTATTGLDGLASASAGILDTGENLLTNANAATNISTPSSSLSHPEKSFLNMKTALESMSRWVARQQLELLPPPIPVSNAPALPAVVGDNESIAAGASASALKVGGEDKPGTSQPSHAPESEPATPTPTTTVTAAVITAAAAAAATRPFEELSCADMAVRIQQGIAQWQEQWSHFA